VYLIVRFRATDFDRWKQAFDQNEDARIRYGGRGHRILRLLDDPDEYLLLLDFASAGGAEGHLQDPSLLELLRAGGVEGGAHHVSYTLNRCEELEASTYKG
jgi:hypothetical protein